MEKSSSVSAKVRLQILKEEIEHFEKLIAGHRKLLEAIGRL